MRSLLYFLSHLAFLFFFTYLFQHRARLVLSVSTEEAGEIQTDEFDCPPEETMSQCGVDGNAKLFVRCEPDHDDDEE